VKHQLRDRMGGSADEMCVSEDISLGAQLIHRKSGSPISYAVSTEFVDADPDPFAPLETHRPERPAQRGVDGSLALGALPNGISEDIHRERHGWGVSHLMDHLFVGLKGCFSHRVTRFPMLKKCRKPMRRYATV
jgi:hypothetical protein